MKIFIKTGKETKENKSVLDSGIEYDIKELDAMQVSYAIAELEKMKLELLEIWGGMYSYKVEDDGLDSK